MGGFTLHSGTDVFEIRQDVIDVTSMNRPDVGRVIEDAAGHLHSWCEPNGVIATHYSPSIRYDMPSLVWVKDGEEYWEDDDEPHDVGHYECRACGAHVVHPMTADTTTQYVAGLKHCYINGISVSLEEFKRRVDVAKMAWVRDR